MEVSEVALNGAKRFAGITILEGYHNANISMVAAAMQLSGPTRKALEMQADKIIKNIFDSGPHSPSTSSRGGGV
jgi:hypothetical protein